MNTQSSTFDERGSRRASSMGTFRSSFGRSLSFWKRHESGVSRSAMEGSVRALGSESPPQTNLLARRIGSCWSVWPPESRKSFWRRIFTSRLWRFLLVVFSILLLFGAQMRTLLLPKSTDLFVDLLFTVMFFFFVADIAMRVDAEPNYFGMRVWCRTPESASEHINMEGCGNCELGSFIFWCEVISTLALLYEISFIAKDNFAERDMVIRLNEFGAPNGGLDGVNEAIPVERELDLIVIIAKTARLARFIKSSTAVNLSSRIPWYWILKRIHPGHLFGAVRRFVCCCSERSKSGREHDRHAMPGESTLARHTSRRGLGMKVLANAKKEAVEKEYQRAQTWKDYPIRALRFVGILKKDNAEWRRQLAATKIQRAWRAVLFQRHCDEGDDVSGYVSNDYAWKARSAGNNAMEKALKKKSILSHFNQMNSRGILIASGGIQKVSDVTVVTESTNTLRRGPSREELKVGSAMRELTGQRVALGIIFSLVLSSLFTYTEHNATRPATMIVLHNQTGNPAFAERALTAARSSAVPNLFEYQLASGGIERFTLDEWEKPTNLRDKEKIRITIIDFSDQSTVGRFAIKRKSMADAVVSLLATIFVILVWFFGVTAFAGPVMVLVVIPIERMVRLLGMLMLDPLGYQSTSRYKRYITDENEITKNTFWSREILKGMETSFLMSTILRIGSLMKVGFGSAGVDIIRNNLEKGQSKNMLILDSQGITVSCIFLFCDIRQFTDATECLQEEVFVFTNRIAAVVHSICHSYGGSANKNIGDAFLLSWLLDEEGGTSAPSSVSFDAPGYRKAEEFIAKHHQADKALLSVVKICMALHHDDFYISTMSEGARVALLSKLSNRSGPVVQLGFGLHAGKAVQGAIGSQRKIDATYVSEAVELAEFLESSTKKYGLKMLMSDTFHRLLHPNNRRRCRKVDQILIQNDDGGDEEELEGDKIELLTFDMDIGALWQGANSRHLRKDHSVRSDAGQESDTESASDSRIKRDLGRKVMRRHSRRLSTRDVLNDELSETGLRTSGTAGDSQTDVIGDGQGTNAPPQLVLPTGPALYNSNVWVSKEIRLIRNLYTDGLFFLTFNSGLQAFYAKDWVTAKTNFAAILDRFEDGPSKYFYDQIIKHKGTPPKDFRGYGIA
jgi:class 3 adenylate cyclase